MTREIRVYIKDILDSIELIISYTKDISKNEFEQNILIQDAVCRRLEVIGESVKNMPSEFKAQFPTLPWRDIAGLRDIISHAYFNIVAARIWNVIEKDLEILKAGIQEIQKSLISEK